MFLDLFNCNQHLECVAVAVLYTYDCGGDCCLTSILVCFSSSLLIVTSIVSESAVIVHHRLEWFLYSFVLSPPPSRVASLGGGGGFVRRSVCVHMAELRRPRDSTTNYSKGGFSIFP